MSQARSGSVVGGYRLLTKLGSGGNGVVWRASGPNGECAIKLLKTPQDTRAQKRFTREITVLTSIGEQEGILPILDSDPVEDESFPQWYTMPIATPILDHVRSLSRDPVQEITKGVIQLFSALSVLHGVGVHHRDIKPSNLYHYNGSWVLSDFGLVDVGVHDVTRTHEQVGPRWSIAPEMQRDPTASDASKADVYSLSKTYWILLTQLERGFEGRYDREDPEISLRQKLADVFWIPVEDLLEAATSTATDSRPTAAECADVLSKWLQTRSDFRTTNAAEWAYVQQRLFPTVVPSRAMWLSKRDIIEVLNLLGSTESLNHMFLPTGGGLDLMGATESYEPDCIELSLQRLPYIMRPQRLVFERVSDDRSWSYFRLEAADLEASGVYDDPGDDDEELAELEPLNYVERYVWDEGEIDGHRLPDSARVVVRHFRGSYVIFSKSSVYNAVSETYDGRHNTMDTDAFREYIARSAKAYESRSGH